MLRLFIAALLLQACAANQAAKNGKTVNMDAVVIRPGPSNDLPTDVYDADTVLHYAREAERARDFAKAKRLYRRLLDEFPESKLARSARFGSGRAEEGLTGCGEALPIYSAIRAEDSAAGDTGEWIDVHFREASCLLNGGRAEEAAKILSSLIEFPSLPKHDKLEAMVGRAIANKERDELGEAERDLVLVFAIDREAKGNTYAIEAETRFTVAKAGYHLGEIYRLRFERAKLEYPQTLLEERLEEKSQHLLRAQQYYLRAIRLGTLEVAAASGFRVGGLYERFHEDLVGLEPPEDLNGNHQKLYMEELRKKIAVLLRKAVKVYDEAIAMARRTGLKSDWIDKATEALDRIKKLYLSDISS